MSLQKLPVFPGKLAGTPGGCPRKNQKNPREEKTQGSHEDNLPSFANKNNAKNEASPLGNQTA